MAGYDLTLSAPKSVSVLFGLGRPGGARGGAAGARQGGPGGDRACGAHGGGGPPRPRRPGRGARQRPGRRVVPAPHLPGRGSAAAHPRRRRELGPGPGRPLVDAGWPADLCAGAHGELHLPRRAARGAVARAGRAVDGGAARDRRSRRDPEAGAPSVQPAPSGDRGRNGAARHVRARGQRGRGAGDALPQEPSDRPRASWPRSGESAPPSSASTRAGSRSSWAAPADATSRWTGSSSSTCWRRRPGLTQGQSSFDRRDVVQALVRAASGGRGDRRAAARSSRRPVPRVAARGRAAARRRDLPPRRRAPDAARARAAALLHPGAAGPRAAAHRPRHRARPTGRRRGRR